MNRHARLSTMIVALSLIASGCVGNKAYRFAKNHAAPPVSVLHEFAPETKLKYSLAFVEFDDVGEMFTSPGQFSRDGDGKIHDNTELGLAISEIERINRGDEGPDPIFVLFIHGWKNNASESSGNVWGFRSALQSMAAEFKPRPVMGIYFGWRGAATSLPVVKEFSFWNRKDAATRIPGAHLTEALRRITAAAKGNPRAKCVVVGHSFGGLVMERTLTQAMVEMLLEHKTDTERVEHAVAALAADQQKTEAEKQSEQQRIDQARQRAEERLYKRMPDLTVLLNEAGPATESKEFLNFLWREDYEFSDGKRVHPLFLSLTSTGDTATHLIFPVGQFLGKHGLQTRKYDGPDEFGEIDQNNYFLHTTANSAKLVNHVVQRGTTGVPGCSENPYTSFSLGGTKYYVCPSPDAKNTTPYWVLQISPEFVPDHSTVFKPELRVLLEAFLKPALAVTAPAAGAEEAQPHGPIQLRQKSNPELKRKDQ